MRKKVKISCVTLALALASVVASCKPSAPSDIISAGKMGDILYDYHIALAMGRQPDQGQENLSIAYREAVLKKYEVTSAEFDSSMVYYMRHTEQLHAIYEDLSERLGKEAVTLGGSADEQSRYGGLTSTGDTASVWNAAPSMVFSPEKPFNNHCFELKVDSSYHKGDRILLDFDAQFIYQDGMRDGMAVLAVTFSNDSVVSQVCRIQNSQHYSIDLGDDDNLGIKSVKGYFLLSAGDFASNEISQTTLKLMFLQHIRMVRMHRNLDPKPQGTLPKDSMPKNVPPGDSARRDSGMTLKPNPGGIKVIRQ